MYKYRVSLPLDKNQHISVEYRLVRVVALHYFISSALVQRVILPLLIHKYIGDEC